MNDEDDSLLIDLYRQRLHIPSRQALPPTYETLCFLVERHLQYIPFENLAFHTKYENEHHPHRPHPTTTPNKTLLMIPLDRNLLQDKLLRQNRGGCCLELNGLLAHLLRALGYSPVWLVPCWVAAGRERGHASRHSKFRTTQSHFVLLVRCSLAGNNHAEMQQYLVDVGLGEPPLHPLHYDKNHLGKIQSTPEGMKSRIIWDPKGQWVDGQGNQRKCLVQEWYQDGEFEPRLQWDVSEAPLDVTQRPVRLYDLYHFAPVISILAHDKSSFSRKLIVCCLTRTTKVSLAGRRLRRTTPRFASSSSSSDDHHISDHSLPQVTITDLSNDHQVKRALLDCFGVTLEEGEILQWNASDASSNSQLWEHL